MALQKAWVTWPGERKEVPESARVSGAPESHTPEREGPEKRGYPMHPCPSHEPPDGVTLFSRGKKGCHTSGFRAPGGALQKEAMGLGFAWSQTCRMVCSWH